MVNLDKIGCLTTVMALVEIIMNTQYGVVHVGLIFTVKMNSFTFVARRKTDSVRVKAYIENMIVHSSLTVLQSKVLL